MVSPYRFGKSSRVPRPKVIRSRKPRPELQNRAVRLREPAAEVLNHLRDNYEYDPETGALTYALGFRAGRLAWTVEAGRPVIWTSVYQGCCERFSARLVCWFLHTKSWPDHNVRAVDPERPLDLRASNLRLVTGRGDNKLARRAG